MKNKPLFFIVVVLLSAMVLLVPNGASEPVTSSQDADNKTGSEAKVADSITVGEYLLFLRTNDAKEDSSCFYSDTMESQIVWTSEDGQDNYEIAAGANDNDLMFGLTSSEATAYSNWIESGSKSSISPLMMFGGGAGDIEESGEVKKPDPNTASHGEDPHLMQPVGTSVAATERATGPFSLKGEDDGAASTSENRESVDQKIHQQTPSDIPPTQKEIIGSQASSILIGVKWPPLFVQKCSKIGFSERTTSAHMNGMMNGMSSSQINSARESLSTAVLTDRSAMNTSPSVGQTVAGHNVTQIFHQEPKKADSPDSIALRNSETKAEEGNPFLGRKISFDPALVEKERAVIHEASTEPAEKAITPDAASDKKFKKCARQFKKLVTNLETTSDAIAEEDPQYAQKVATIYETVEPEIKLVFQKLLKTAPEKAERAARVAAIYAAATPKVKEYLRLLLGSMSDYAIMHRSEASEEPSELGHALLSATKLFEMHFFLAEIKAGVDQISEDDPDKSSKVAVAYAAAYPQIKEQLQSFLKAIGRGEIVKDQHTALVLGCMAIEVVETAFNTLDWQKMEPIKIQEGMNDTVILARKIPWRDVPYAKDVEVNDAQDRILIHEAENVINNIQNTMKALVASDADAPSALHKSCLLKAHKTSMIALMKECAAHRLLDILVSLSPSERPTGVMEEARAESQQAALHYKKSAAAFSDLLRSSQTSYLPEEAKQLAITEILIFDETILEASDQLINTLIARMTH